MHFFFILRIMLLFRLRKTVTFCNISVITEDIYLKLGVCVNCPNSNPYYQGRQFKMHFFFFFIFRIMLLFRLRKTVTFCNIFVITEDIYLQLEVCVHYSKSNPYYQGRQCKMHFFQNYAPLST